MRPQLFLVFLAVPLPLDGMLDIAGLLPNINSLASIYTAG